MPQDSTRATTPDRPSLDSDGHHQQHQLDHAEHPDHVGPTQTSSSSSASSSQHNLHSDDKEREHKFDDDDDDDKERRDSKDFPLAADNIPLPTTSSDPRWRHVGVAFHALGVKGFGGQARMVEDLPVSLVRMWDAISWVRKLANIHSGPTSWIIKDVYGLCDAGEMMLVLGRPGSGCSTLLKALSNDTAAFAKPLAGDLRFSNIGPDEAAKRYAGQIVFNGEEDIHLPELSVRDTLGMANMLKAPANLADTSNSSRREYANDQVRKLLDAFGMPHTAGTFVGNEVVRGVSGGERKRVSLTEVLSTNPAIACWDNSTRGLDSAVAYHYIRILRQLSRITGMANVVSIYQASQAMYDCFDRVVVLYDGQLAFSGRAADAEHFFTQWFVKDPRTTTPDFLTGCTSATERRIRPDLVGPAPLTATEMAEAFRKSVYFQKVVDEVDDYRRRNEKSEVPRLLDGSVRAAKHRLTSVASPYVSNIFEQTAACIRRQVQLTINSSSVIITQAGSIVLNAVLTGAVLYKPPASAAGSFRVAGGLFFILLYLTIMGFSEVPNAFATRSVLVKHRKAGFYTPVAQLLGQVSVDLPLYAIYSIVFCSVYYFMLGLSAAASQFFTTFFIVASFYLAIAMMFRMIAAWSPNMTTAIRYSALALSFTLTVSGFGLPAPSMLGWARWMQRTSVTSWALEALLGNEFKTRVLTCSQSDLVPSGPGYTDPQYQTCSIIGAEVGSSSVPGRVYLERQYGFDVGHIWRNVGIIWAFYFIFFFMTILGSNLTIREGGGSAATKIYKRGSPALKRVQVQASDKATDVESAAADLPAQASGKDIAKAQPRAASVDGSRGVGDEKQRDAAKRAAVAKIASAGQPFTFQNVSYSVQVVGKDRKLLDNVSGYVQPGKLSALMGASGAGKTTLLDTISQRKTSGTVEGTFLLDGRPLLNSFGRRTGFVMQGDIHEPYSTVRECLQFSALLRQPAHVPRSEKLAYAEEVLRLLELEELADAIIGAPGIGGLGIEHRKRVTIAVELAAKPDSILFLDEPTSGLDSQGAFEIVRLLRKISSEGISVLATIHQPSSNLFSMFDEIILLAPGGKTVYAGETGEGAQAVLDYFAKQGVYPPSGANPAEFFIETVAPVGGSKIDYAERWKVSPEAARLQDRIAELNSSSQAAGGEADSEQRGGGGEADSRFASTWTTQFVELSRRYFRAQIRDGSYLTSRLVNNVFFGLFTSFFFYRLPHTAAAPQALSLCLLILVQTIAPMTLDIATTYFKNMDLYLARERNGIYSWTAALFAHWVEIPFSVFGAVVLYFCSTWTYNVPVGDTAGLLFLVWIGIGVFGPVSGVLLGAASSDPFAASFVLSLCWNLINTLSGVIAPLGSMPQPFRAVTWITPLRYLYASMVSSVISPITITCLPSQLVHFAKPPAEASCQSYADAFLNLAPGYLVDQPQPEGQGLGAATCAYCPYSTGKTYVDSIGYSYHTRWRDWAIFLVFILVNIALATGLTWWMRIRPLSKK
ncbi:uncharacterized protein PFL1_06749 [Pseudozyma flocculosa PF-1]|uniref:Related to ATP-binding cassette multidrug transport protein n=2 Tax=Pseudozyma flocculosa TaxID=84751 RepID=A0A5C3F7J0_9BASI|nr:uncharacterized protein PFL1_06749 [Pseudozyma flocculosa PF-1]EPQ25677.1 hypothetical protein PFL1_06749 [Pseudozyma flocculosa PF-1]SPO40453.1 related to ATP-binding cassette multidrug transport protein [Pseudozyma flocculosa]